MVVRIALFLLLAASAFGQVVITDGFGTVTPTCVITVQQTLYQGVPCNVTVTTGSSFTIGEDGNINPHARWCDYNPTLSNVSVQNCTNSNLANTYSGQSVYYFRIFAERFNATSETPATFTRHSTVTIGAVVTTLTVTITIVPRTPPPVFTTWNGALQPVSGCTNGQSLANPTTPDPVYYIAGNICDTTVGRPGNPLTLPAPGGTFADQRFGTPIHVLANHQNGYGNANYTSIDPATGLSDLILTEEGADYPPNPAAGIFSYPGGQKIYPHPNYAGMTGSYKNCVFYSVPERMAQFGLPKASLNCFREDVSPPTMVQVTGASPPTLVNAKTIFTLPHGPYVSSGACDATGRMNHEGYRIMWGVYSSSCGDDTIEVKTHWKYLHVVDTFTGVQAEIDLNDPRLAWPWPVFTRSARLTDMDSSGKMYVHIFGGTITGTNVPTALILWVKPPDSAHPAGQWGVQTWGGASNWPVGSNGMNPLDCTSKNVQCKNSSHEWEYQSRQGGGAVVGTAFGDEGLSSSDPFGSAFIQFGCGSMSLLPQELGGCGAFAGFGTHDHGGCSPNYPLCASSWEADGPSAPGNGINLNPVMMITSISGSTLTVTDNECTSGGSPCYNTGMFNGQSVVVGCENDDPGTISNPRGIWTVASVTSTTMTLTGYSAGGGTNSGKCAVTLHADVNNVYGLKSISIIAVDRLSANGVPFQRVLLAKPLNTSFLSGMHASEYWEGQSHPSISVDGRFAYWTAGAGYPNFLRLLAAEVPWQMRALYEYEFAPGYPGKMAGGTGSMAYSIKVPGPESIRLYIDKWASLAQATGACSGTVTTGCYVDVAGPSLNERTGTVTLGPGTYHWRGVSIANNKYVAQGVFTVN